MPRSLPDSDGSQKENHAVRPPSKAKARPEPRSRRDERAQTRHSASTLTDGDDDNDDNAEDGSPNGRKRARLNEDGDAVPVKDEHVPRPRRVTLPRDRDGYVPGSIVRVQLENFVTYDWVEFRPGPNLNMILGPNGTGKSSIACALCIGLNGAPSILGRSSELNAFVKHGHDTGFVEIELKGPIGSPNLVIRRNINAKNRQSSFTLNAEPVPAREISARIAELNVQVGNLCSFLPQDRVSEFALMTPQQLLKETQRTAGDQNLTIWHATLIEKGKELDMQQSSLKEDKKLVAQLEEKQKALEKDVKRYHERREIEQKIELLELVLPYIAYTESKRKYDEARVVRAAAHKEYKRLEEANMPLKLLQAELNDEDNALGSERTKLKKDATDKFKKSMTSIESRVAKATTQGEEALDMIKSLKRKQKDRLRNIAKTRDDVAKWQAKVDNPPEYEDLETINELMKPLKEQKVELDLKRNQIKGQVETLVNDTTVHARTVEQCKIELRKLDSVKDQKIKSLQRWDHGCAEVVMWLEKNRETNPFAARVALPAFVGVKVPNERYMNAVEACFTANQIKTFVTHSEEDFKTFNRLFVDTPEALGKKVHVTVWYRPQNEAQLAPPPLDINELKDIGFDGYAIDYVECPEALKWFLVKEVNMHRTPVALDARRVDERAAQDALSRLGAGGRPPPNCTYIAGDTLGMVSRSMYGNRKSMNTTRTITRARNLVDPAGDPAAKREVEQRLARAQELGAELAAQIGELGKQDHALKEEMTALKDPHDKLLERKRAAGEIVRQITTNKTKLSSFQRNLEDLESRPSEDLERPRHQATVEKSVKERTKLLNEFLTQTRGLIKTHSKLSTMLLQQTQLKAKVEAIETLCDERTAEARRVKQAFDEASARFQELKIDSKDKLAKLTDQLNNVSPELNKKFRALEEEEQGKPPEDQWTSEKVEGQLDMERARLDLNNVTDSGVIQVYERREQEIKTSQKNVERKEEKVRKLEEKIQKTKAVWYPALTDLVAAIGEKFSAAFDRIGRAGEIRIAEAEDYDKWAIEIYVKFREDEPLTLLTAQRQSGGERSLTTIMYLMSLTEHARAPFSLVDEINQGMDQEYERSVHDQLVNVTCNTDSGQYFLITPKLLPGLQYHKGMKVLFVNNGEWLPDSKGLGNMGKMIDGVLAKRTAT